MAWLTIGDLESVGFVQEARGIFRHPKLSLLLEFQPGARTMYLTSNNEYHAGTLWATDAKLRQLCDLFELNKPIRG